MVRLKTKNPKQYHRDNYENNKEEFKRKRRERYATKPKVVIIKAKDTLVIKAKNIIICDHTTGYCSICGY